jgi:predicted RNA-binding protein with TRAM domain
MEEFRRAVVVANWFLPERPIAGQEYEVEIDNLAGKDDGIAKVNGFLVFVQGGGAKLNQRVRVRIIDVRARFALAEIVH